MTDQQAFDFTRDYRATDPETSRLAAIYSLPNRTHGRAVALEALTAAGEQGLTDFELEAVTGIKQTSIGKRRKDLCDAGLVVGRMVIDPATLQLRQDRRPAPSGAKSLVWVAAEHQRADAAT